MSQSARAGGPARILFCESNVDGTIGGSHYCLLHLIEQLDRSAYEPMAMFYEEHALIERFRATAETTVDPPRAAVRWGAARGSGWRARTLVVLRRTVNFARFLMTVVDRARFLRKRRIDVLHLNNSITRHHDWMWAALLTGVPCLTHERGSNPRYSALDRFHARRLELVIPVSRWIRDHMVAKGVAGENVIVLYDGLDPATIIVARPENAVREEWNIRPDQPVVGIVGNIREWKGQETVVRALAEVVTVAPDVVCFFIGAVTPSDQPYAERLLRLIAEAGIERNVRFTGYQRDVNSFVNIMQFVVHASIQPEPFGMVVLEAMALRKAVVGSRAGGVVEMVVEGETGYTFPMGDWRALAAKMTELLGAPALATKMGEAGYARLASSFTLAQYMDRIQRVYRAILDRRPAPAAAEPAPVRVDAP